MQDVDLPRHIDLERIGREPRAYAGKLPSQSMAKLMGLVDDAAGIEASIQVAWAQDQTHAAIRGECGAYVTLICERCLEPMDTRLAGEFEVLAVDRAQQADDLPVDQAVVEAPRGQLDVVSLIEDELILGLPVVPRHEDTACDGGQRHFGPEDEPLPQAESPFAALGALRQNNGSSDTR